MLRGREFGILAGATLCAVMPLTAQTRVKLQRNVGASPLQAAIAELTVPARMKAAQQRLWLAGQPAVPLLAAEIERGGAGEAAARYVLEQLGCEAAAAVPVLQRILADPETKLSRRARVAATLAKIDGPPIILLPLYVDDAVLELDLDGHERRRVAVESPWGAWPMPDDHLGVLSFAKGRVLRSDWQGQQETMRTLEDASGSAVPLDELFAGDLVFTTWKDRGQLICRDAEGKDLWQRDVDAVRVERDFGDELIVVTRANPRIVWFSREGKEVRSLALSESCHNVQPLAGGGYLVSCNTPKVIELGPDGSELRHFVVDADVNDIVRLHDGRTLVSTEKQLIMLDAKGDELWSKKTGFGGPLFVRHPAREAR
ncbi:MAG: hypothetical protein R3F29_07025 [Planctomycetota bacterium]